ncbi:MAG TPA: bifunctional (p)ppGpp synthetase/guanosine-3',5'-bis(diphosphate) 3'-pyrophosphohydrolase [Xanthomonadales bacterium]|nr:bifunctional (p)ppGpp synthetase/guanosine-3',5'-bis(diphosphate) 3'-pyrophosphohydrolase [Xanthomonadales bacterium]
MTTTDKKVSGVGGLRDWMDAYKASVGEGAELCSQLLEALLKKPLRKGEDQSRLLSLLQTLSALAPDPQTLSCAMIYATEELGGDCQSARELLTPDVISRLEQLERLQAFESQPGQDETERSAEGLRRLLLALVEDVRVVLIDLAWQLVQLREVDPNSDQATALARETRIIHAPLANRLGVWQLKWELEDLAFRYLDPDQYQRIARLVAERRVERERFIGRFMDKLSDALKESGITAEVRGRPKHIFSIWKKMQRKGIDFHQLFDVRAVRVLVEDLPDCYSALGLVHTLWQPIPGEFDDYITTPKGNNYQSLHTAVADPEGRAVEVQIRTTSMHEHAELGVAAHWRYKEGGPTDPAFDNKIAVMRQLLESSDAGLDDQSLLDSFQSATTEDRVYALTPRGQVVDLAAGSSVLDFAYHVHTEVGHRCRGAKINGRIVPLTQEVKTGNRVEILTGKHPRPSRDWLNPRLGYINGARARAKVRQWFRKESHDDNLKAGKDAVESEAKRMGMPLNDLKSLAERFGFKGEDDLFVAVGNGDLTVSQVVHAFERMRSERIEPQAEDLLTLAPVRQRGNKKQQSDDVRIEGVGNLMTSIARCCHPLPGDAVVGYVTQGRGVTIHREDCRQVLGWRSENNPRLLKVTWGRQARTDYTARVQVRAFDRRELIKDISSVLATSEANVAEISSHLDEITDEVTIRLKLKVRDYEQLSELLNKLASVPNVLETRRLAD